MTATIVAIRSAVAAALNEHDFSVEFEAVESYADWKMELKAIDNKLHVDVVISGHTGSDLDDRGHVGLVNAIDVGIRYKLPQDAREEGKEDGRLRTCAIDPLVELVEEIVTFFAADRLEDFDDASWRDCQIRATYVREHLEDWKQFTAIIRLAFDTTEELE